MLRLEDAERYIRGRAEGMVHDGYALGYRFAYRQDVDAIDLHFDLERGRDWNARLTRHEAMMDGMRAVAEWCNYVRMALRDQFERNRQMVDAAMLYGSHFVRYRADGTAEPIPPDQVYQLPHPDPRPVPHLTAGDGMRVDMLYGWAPVYVGWDLAPDTQAEARAADLFRMVAGTDAFNLLESGQALAIIGSQGTKYTLHKRASYCVERVKDGAKLCAVVPGVPLWDHLLGIKMMVEHDEPKFLKTANVSGGTQANVFARAREWTAVAETQEQRDRFAAISQAMLAMLGSAM